MGTVIVVGKLAFGNKRAEALWNEGARLLLGRAVA
jgi:hypothetical protein